jgi:hypothetical protein
MQKARVAANDPGLLSASGVDPGHGVDAADGANSDIARKCRQGEDSGFGATIIFAALAGIPDLADMARFSRTDLPKRGVAREVPDRLATVGAGVVIGARNGNHADGIPITPGDQPCRFSN